MGKRVAAVVVLIVLLGSTMYAPPVQAAGVLEELPAKGASLWRAYAETIDRSLHSTVTLVSGLLYRSIGKVPGIQTAPVAQSETSTPPISDLSSGVQSDHPHSSGVQSSSEQPQTVIENTVHLPQAASPALTITGISRAEFEARLAALDARITSGIRPPAFVPSDFTTHDLFTRQIGATYDSVGRALGNYLPLGGDTISGRLTVNGVTGLTDADIPDTITAANYLPLAGGTIAGDLTVSGAFTGGALSLANASTTLLSVLGPAYFGSTATSTFGTDGSLTLAGLGTWGSGFLSQASSTVAGNFTTTGANTFGGALTVAGDTTLANATIFSLFVEGTASALSATIGALIATSSLAIYGPASFGATATSTFAANGALTLASALTVPSGGTGWATVEPGALLYGAGASALATTTQGGAGQVLAYLNGVPTWTATTTYAGGLTYSNGTVANTGVLSLAQTYGAAQAGALTFATSTLAFNGLTLGTAITNTGSAFTFMPTLAGTLAAGGGGTGISTPAAAGILLGSYAGGAWQQVATSSLGLLTTHVAEGGNLYWTSDRFDARLAASTTIPTITSLANLATVGTITTGIWQGSVIGASYGGAGTVNGILKANGSGTVSAAVADTDYQAPVSAAWPVTFSANTIGWGGIATSSAPATGNLAYWTGTKTLGTAATTTVACAGVLSCTTFAAIGASPITLTSSAAPFPFTETAYGVATSTTLGFLSGFLSTASSTFTASTNFPGGIWNASGNVGIGTTNPGALLEVSNSITIGSNTGDKVLGQKTQFKLGTNQRVFEVAAVRTAAEGATSWHNTAIRLEAKVDGNTAAQQWIQFISGVSTSLNAISFGEGDGSGNEWVRIADGNLGIGTTTPSAKFSITQSAQTAAGGLWLAASDNTDFRSQFMDTSGILSFYGGDTAGTLNTATLNAAGEWTNASDRAYKERIEDLSYGLDALLLLQPRSYVIKNTEDVRVGFIAQEVELVLPEVVSGAEGSKGISYGNLVAVVVKAVQELTSEMRSLAATVAGFARSFVSDDITVNNRLCVGRTCITETELKALLAGQGSPAPTAEAENSVHIAPGPTIKLLGESPLRLAIGDTFIDPGVSVTDPLDGAIPYRTYMNGIEQEVSSMTISTTEPATYLITYAATNSAGNSVSITRSVIIADPDGSATAAPAPDSPANKSSDPADSTAPAADTSISQETAADEGPPAADADDEPAAAPPLKPILLDPHQQAAPGV
jgi:hypothetical protein